jgi:hypothetical protein
MLINRFLPLTSRRLQIDVFWRHRTTLSSVCIHCKQRYIEYEGVDYPPSLDQLYGLCIVLLVYNIWNVSIYIHCPCFHLWTTHFYSIKFMIWKVVPFVVIIIRFVPHSWLTMYHRVCNSSNTTVATCLRPRDLQCIIGTIVTNPMIHCKSRGRKHVATVVLLLLQTRWYIVSVRPRDLQCIIGFVTVVTRRLSHVYAPATYNVSSGW